MKNYKLDEVFNIIKNGASIKQDDIYEGYPITRIETISKKIIDRNKMGYAGVINLDKYSDYILKSGDILMSHINSEKHLGKTAIYEKMNNETIIHGMNLLMLRTNQNILIPKYAYYYLNSNSFKRQIPKITKKSVNQASFTVKALKELNINLPGLDEQFKIIELLDKVDLIIKLRKKQLEKLEILVKSQFIEMFGDPISGEKSDEFPELGAVCELRAGKFIKANDIHAQYELGLYPCYGGNGIRGYVVDYNQVGEYPLVGRQGALCGNIQFAQGRFYATEHAVVVTPKVEMDRYWLYFLLLKLQLNRYASGAAQPGLAVSKLENIRVCIPSIESQIQFSSLVKQTDKSKFMLQLGLEKLESLNMALMQKYFM